MDGTLGVMWVLHRLDAERYRKRLQLLALRAARPRLRGASLTALLAARTSAPRCAQAQGQHDKLQELIAVRRRLAS